MRLEACALCCLFIAGCPESTVRRVDSPRPALICRNTSSVVSLEARVLQDVAGGCFLLWLKEGGGLHLGPGFQEDVGSGVGLSIFGVVRAPAPCSDLPADSPWTRPAEVSGWLSIDVDADGAPILDASFDAIFGPDHPEIPTAEVRIENMNLNDREGGIQCVP